MNADLSYSPELLAPAGNWECAKAAVANGANAIYFGLPRFNARLRADNFSEEDLPELMTFLHSHGVCGFVTMNTLVFSAEVRSAIDYLRVLESAGVDGVIVQDIGLASLVKKAAPGLELHASTQMTLTSPEAVSCVRRWLPLDRVVLARELNLSEIRRCRPEEIPTEVFVHGALCVSYSGQCLTSESLGQRSANRGECAQACRMPYELIVDGRPVPMGERRYLLSPQDLAALDCLPELVEMGVKSFKIEGRLKSPEYVAAVTGVYRKALDAACDRGRRGPAVTPGDRYALEMVFSRGFSTGWLEGPNHPALTHGRYGKKRGSYVGEIERAGRGWIDVEFAADIPLAAGDGFVFDAGEDRNLEQGGRIWKRAGSRLFFHGKSGNIDWTRIMPGMKLWKTDDPVLNASLRKSWKNCEPGPVKSPLNLVVTGKCGSPLVLSAPDYGVCVSSAEHLQAAEKRPLTEETLRAQLGRLGETDYELKNLTVQLSGDVLLPLSALNKLRRLLVEELDGRAPLASAPQAEPAPVDYAALLPAPVAADAEKTPALKILCRHLYQLEALLDAGARFFYLDFEDIRQYRAGVELVRNVPGAVVYLATPRIQKPGETGFFHALEQAGPDGILARNWGAVEYFRDRNLPMIGDFSLNVSNEVTADLLLHQGGLELVTVSYDLNARQVLDLARAGDPGRMELVLHQHMPLFHMEHCVFCTFLSKGENFRNCGRPCERHTVHLRDRVGQNHRLMADAGCRNTLYNGRAQTGAAFLDDFRRAGLASYRLELLDDTAGEAVALYEGYRDLLAGQSSARLWLDHLDAIERLGVTEGTLKS